MPHKVIPIAEGHGHSHDDCPICDIYYQEDIDTLRLMQLAVDQIECEKSKKDEDWCPSCGCG